MADLSVTVSDTITVSGRKYGAERTHTISGVNNVVHGFVDIPNASYFNLLAFESSASQGFQELTNGALKYLRITNTDSTNSIFVSWSTNTGAATPPHDLTNQEIPAGCSFVLFADDNDTASSFTVTQNNLYRIALRATGGTAVADIFLASA